MPEAYETHAEAIDWHKDNKQFSPIKIPPRALGLNPVMVALTKLALSSEKAFHVIEKYLFGLLLPRFLMDYQTAIKSSAIFVLRHTTPVNTHAEMIESGRAMVRFWLMANKLGFGYQPQYTPVLFAEYLRKQYAFTKSDRALTQAKKVNLQFKALAGNDTVDCSVYMGRIGRTEEVSSRSVRMSVEELLVKN